MARRPPEDFRVDRPSMAQIASPPTVCCPCGAPAVPLPRKVPCIRGWLEALLEAGWRTAGPGKVPAACHGLPAWFEGTSAAG